MALVAAPLAATPASANTAGTGLIIAEVYANGGSASASYTHKYVELFNPTTQTIALDGLSLQYRSATGEGAPSSAVELVGSIAAGKTFLVQGASNGSAGDVLPTPDQGSVGLNFARDGGVVILANQREKLPALKVGSDTGNPAILDLVGYGTATTFEETPASGNSVTASISRTEPSAGTSDTGTSDTDNNGIDLSAGTPTPKNQAGATSAPAPAPAPEQDAPAAGASIAISAIQGTSNVSPVAGETVTTRGVITASFPTGGFDGYYLQTPGTGGALNSEHVASDGIFIYSPQTVASATVGALVEVTGLVSEYFGLTQLTVGTGGMTALTGPFAAPTAVSSMLPTGDNREALEGMLVRPSTAYTVTDNYNTNIYGSVVLAQGSSPFVQPTSIVRPGSEEREELLADYAARSFTLDDGSTLNFRTAANTSTPIPYLSTTNPVRIGAPVTFSAPVVLDYRFSAWNLQPTTQLTAANAKAVQPATFGNTRAVLPKEVGGDATLASFNVLNYFATTGAELGTCRYYNDREGNPITVRGGCDARGAANTANFERQQAKIVSAINSLDADVVSLEEVENSAAFDKPRDFALSRLTTALNTAAGSAVWSFVPSPSAPPTPEDVIRTAFIYRAADIELVGQSRILDDPAFVNARRPLAQAFQLVGGGASSGFIAIVNHFKSKGSGSGPGNTDAGDGQGASNASRVAQAEALVAFASEFSTAQGIDRVLLSGDFNAYLEEDPIRVITDAGYVDLGSTTAKSSYSYDGMTGSLDHIFASNAAQSAVSGVDIWNINSVESIALEYSRFNSNVTNFYQPNAYRSSDHDPILVGLNLFDNNFATVNLLNINDFHGRIDRNTTKFAGTVEQLRATSGAERTLFLSSGDNIGASLFASSSQQDQPTIDVLNALHLRASAVGNHEFDAGFADLTDRVIPAADWSYLGANVYRKGTMTPALPEFEIFTVGALRVAVIGAVTQETPTLVTPGGISGLEFGDPVAAVNRVAAQLSAADSADLIVANYHEGAGSGTPDGATLEQETALSGSAFAKIVTETSAHVNAIFTGHTHKQYAWNAPIPGKTGTRPVLQTGSYGENIGQVLITVNLANDSIVRQSARNVARSAASEATLVATYPAVAEVKSIVDTALAEAAVRGNAPIGSVTADITTAFSGTSRDDRSSESTLGNLVADSLVESLSDPTLGGAEIGIVNPGGLRSDLRFAGSDVGEGNGVVTFGEANAVLPFVNNLWTTTLTGAQFKLALEQQWQTDAAGNVPARNYLALGLSSNVSYTYDASRVQGDRVTTITVNGQPIDPVKGYRIGSFSFLLQGGDNFRVFADGASTRDSGLIDRDAWISFISANSPLSPAFDRRGVSVTATPSAPLAPGASSTVTLSKLDLTSLGAPTNTRVRASFAASAEPAIESAVDNGSSTVSFTVPADVGRSGTLIIVALESGTTIRIPIAIAAATGTAPAATGAPLAFTGADIGPAGSIALLVIFAGLVLLAVRRRSHHAEGVRQGFASGKGEQELLS